MLFGTALINGRQGVMQGSPAALPEVLGMSTGGNVAMQFSLQTDEMKMAVAVQGKKSAISNMFGGVATGVASLFSHKKGHAPAIGSVFKEFGRRLTSGLKKAGPKKITVPVQKEESDEASSSDDSSHNGSSIEVEKMTKEELEKLRDRIQAQINKL